jgi:hypothetical protein
LVSVNAIKSLISSLLVHTKDNHYVASTDRRNEA